MRRKNVKITPLKKTDKKITKAMEAIANYQWDKNGGIIQAIISARLFVENFYGKKTPDNIWERIMEEVVKKELKEVKL